jgi:hypothetical protein
VNDRLSTLLVVGSFVIDKLIVVGVFCLGVWLATGQARQRWTGQRAPSKW